MIVTNVKKLNNFIICYGSLRNGDVIYHKNDKDSGLHSYFYGIRGDGYVLCPSTQESVHPENMERYIENVSRFHFKPLEYHCLSENNLEYIMVIKKQNYEIISLSDKWYNTGESEVITIDENETILCFEGEAEIVHNNGTKTLRDFASITSSTRQGITVKSTNNAKIIRVKCKKTN